MKIKQALISVYDKTDIVEFCKELEDLGYKLIASGGTAKVLMAAGITVLDTTDLVGPAILGHRVVTLDRGLMARLLARLDNPDDLAELERLGMAPINLVCCDFYPLEKEIAKADATLESVIEQTDIGGPAMVRAAAKGGRIVICDPADRAWVLDEIRQNNLDEMRQNNCDVSAETIQKLRATAERVTAEYSLAAATYHSGGDFAGLVGRKFATPRYGENAYLTPVGFYGVASDDPLAITNFTVVAGAAPSYNNYLDIHRLLQTMTHIAAGYERNGAPTPFIAVGCKHGNACGAANDLYSKKELIENMVMGDPRAIFGGLVMMNFPITAELAEVLHTVGLTEGRRLYDGIIAPSFEPEAIELLKRKGDKCRFIRNPALNNSLGIKSLDTAPIIRQVRGGFLKQPNYTFVLDLRPSNPDLQMFGKRVLISEGDLILAWAVCCTSNSNTITLVKNGQLIGNGVAQQDRVGAAELAIKRAHDSGHDINGAVACSDSFFPFPDAVEALIKAGVKAIFSTSGSINDAKIQQLCLDSDVTLYQMPDTLARGFFGH